MSAPDAPAPSLVDTVLRAPSTAELPERSTAQYALVLGVAEALAQDPRVLPAVISLLRRLPEGPRDVLAAHLANVNGRMPLVVMAQVLAPGAEPTVSAGMGRMAEGAELVAQLLPVLQRALEHPPEVVSAVLARLQHTPDVLWWMLQREGELGAETAGTDRALRLREALAGIAFTWTDTAVGAQADDLLGRLQQGRARSVPSGVPVVTPPAGARVGPTRGAR